MTVEICRVSRATIDPSTVIRYSSACPASNIPRYRTSPCNSSSSSNGDYESVKYPSCVLRYNKCSFRLARYLALRPRGPAEFIIKSWITQWNLLPPGSESQISKWIPGKDLDREGNGSRIALPLALFASRVRLSSPFRLASRRFIKTQFIKAKGPGNRGPRNLSRAGKSFATRRYSAWWAIPPDIFRAVSLSRAEFFQCKYSIGR